MVLHGASNCGLQNDVMTQTERAQDDGDVMYIFHTRIVSSGLVFNTSRIMKVYIYSLFSLKPD